MSVTTLFTPVLSWSRRAKQAFALLADVLAALVAVWLAFYLRIEQVGMPVQQQLNAYAAALLFVPVFIRLGLYRAVFRYAGMRALAATAMAVGIYGSVFFAVLLIARWEGVPRSLGLIQPLVFLLLAGGWRVLARYGLLQMAGAGQEKAKGQLLIYGAGEAGVQTAFAMSVMREFVVRGFVDDDGQKIGRSINGLPIIAPDALEVFVQQHGITDILLAIPSLSRQQRHTIIARLQPLPAHVRTLPGMVDLASGKVSVADFQELDIEDLLGRAPVQPDATLLAKNLRDKVVLVTGAGGSIGSELCRQIVQERPRQLVLLDHNEFGLYAIHQELSILCTQQELTVELLPKLASIRSLRRVRAVFTQYQPQSVFHAAAYKHVPLVQSNPSEGVLNNLFGTLNTARAAMEVGVENFVLISTDKAVRPTNVMGATKRMAELVLQSLADAQAVDFSAIDETEGQPPISNRTRFCMVRFGNVLGSSGSVVPLFRKQLRQGGPLTVTHTEVTRYFMTIPEAAQLVLQAGAMGQDGEVFVLDMGQPIRIIDLAKRMVELSGLQVQDDSHPEGDIAIKVVGLRPGEKLYEELLIGENPEPTSHPRIMKAHENFLSWPDLLPDLLVIRAAAKDGNIEKIQQTLGKLVSGYKANDCLTKVTHS